MRGQGCVAADLNADGRTDLYVTTADYDKLLWNNGDGTFTRGARAAGSVAPDGTRGRGRRRERRRTARTSTSRATPITTSHPDSLPQASRTTSPASGTSSTSTSAVTGGGQVPRGRRPGGARGRALRPQPRRCLRTSTTTGGSTSTWPTTGTQPALPERRWPGGRKADPAGLGFRFEERAAAAGGGRPERRDGRRRGGLLRGRSH